MKRLLATIAAVLWATTVSVAEPPYRTAEDRLVDIRHIQLDLDVQLREKRIAGTARIDFAARRELQTLRLDAVNHRVAGVAGRRMQAEEFRRLEYANTGEQLLINFPETVCRGGQWRIRIRYQVHDPASGLYFFGPSQRNPEVPLMVWSQGEPESNRYWFPCLDHPNERQSSELIVTVPAGFQVLSNGRLLQKRKLDDGEKVRFHWKQAKSHVAYLVTLVVGRFHVAEEKAGGVRLSYYVPPERKKDVQRTFGRTAEMLQFFSRRFGIDYPWSKYAQVVVEQFIAGGMENTSATTLYEGVLHNRRALIGSRPDWLIAHELGHQWWGDLLTCRDWAHLWLNEGFATYCEVLWAEHKFGCDERDYRLYKKSRSARSGTARKRPVLDRHYQRPWSMFDSRAYPKGAWILHMLRHRLGEDDFFEGLKQYGTRHAYQTVETADLRGELEEISGLTLQRFFHEWTRRPGHPQLRVASRYQADEHLLRIEVEQTQDEAAFHFPWRMDVAVPGREQPIRLQTTLGEKREIFYLPAEKRPRMIRLDPEFSLLAEIEAEQPRDWWKTQLLEAPTVPERIRAVEHFGNSQADGDRKLLRQVLQKDPFYGVRIEAAAALGESGGQPARKALIAGLKQDHPRVRKACAKALGQFPGSETAFQALRKKIRQGDRSYYVQAAAIESLGQVQHPPLSLLLEQLEKPSHREVIRRAALKAMAHSEQEKALNGLLKWSRPAKPRPARLAAISAVPNYFSRQEVSEARQTAVLDRLKSYLDEEGSRIRRAGAQALGELGSLARGVLSRLQALADHDPSGRVREAAEEAVEAIQRDAPTAEELQNLRGRIEELQEETRQLQDRLEKREAG